MSEEVVHVPDTGSAPKTPRARRATLGTLKHGGRMLRLPVGNLPKKLRPLGREARAYRADLEFLVMERHGQIDALAAHEIALAVEAFLHQAIGRWLLRERLGSMEAADILNCSASMLKAGELRNKAIARLKLEPLPNDPLSVARRFYEQQAAKRLAQSPPQEP